MLPHLYSKPVQTLDLTHEAQHLLHLWRQNDQYDPLVALQELITNAYDATLNRPESPILIEIEDNTIVIQDHGNGMDRETIEKVFSFFDKKVSDGDGFSRIAEFGIGRFRLFALAERIEITTKAEGEGESLRLFWHWRQPRIHIFSADCDVPGTTIRLYFQSRHIPLLKTDSIQKYLQQKFACLLRPIHLNRHFINPVASWLMPIVRQAEKQKETQTHLLTDEQSQQMVEPYFPKQNPIASYLEVEDDGTRILLSISKPNENDSGPGLQLCKKGVWVCSRRKSPLDEDFPFLKIMVDSPYFGLNIERTEVAETDLEYLELESRLRQAIWHFFSLLADEQPDILQEILRTYASRILTYALRNHNWQRFLAQHYPMFNLNHFVSWQTIRQSLKAKAPNPRLALIYTEAELDQEYEGVLVLTEDYEREFVKNLAADTEIEVIELDKQEVEEKEKSVAKLYWINLVKLAIAQLQQLGIEDYQLSYVNN